MKQNLHKYDRALRIAGGTLLSSLAFWGPKKPWLLGFIAPVLSGVAGSCPLYSAFNLDTRNKDEKELANDYMPVQSDSERAMDHPIVGAV